MMSNDELHLRYSIEAQNKDSILKESAPLLKAHIKSTKIWEAMQIADYKKEGVLNTQPSKFCLRIKGKT
jgi:hypothetical protein